MLRELVLFACVCSVASLARADRVHLKGGTVIEGKVTTLGDKVLVQLESGQISLPATSVERIEESVSALERVEHKLKQLKPSDEKGLLKLANECRDQDLPDSERKVLRKLLELDPDHPEARARLGFVHTERGWITQDEARREKGLVKQDGVWLTREQAFELERLKTAAATAKLAQQQAEAALEAQRAQLDESRASAEAARARAEEQASARVPSASSVVIVHQGAPVAPVLPLVPYPLIPRLTPPSAGFTQPMPIPGVRDPRDMTFSIPGVQDPHKR